MPDRFHDAIDDATRLLERIHDAVAQLRAHRLFPNRKVFYGGCVAALTYVLEQLLGIHDPLAVGAIPAAAGYVTSYMFSDGPRIEYFSEGEAIDHEASHVREKERRDAELAERPLDPPPLPPASPPPPGPPDPPRPPDHRPVS